MSSKSRKSPFQGFKDAAPFLTVFALWGLLVMVGLSFHYSDGSDRGQALKWFILFYGLGFFNLFAAGMALLGVFGLMKYSKPLDRAPFLIKTMVWGTAKLGILGVILYTLSQAKDAPFLAILAGISTLLIVPLIGGLSWSIRLKARKTLKKR